MKDNLYDIAREVTDEVLGEGTYAAMNKDNPNPGVQAAIKNVRSTQLCRICRVNRVPLGQHACEVCD
jgi:hypothetical protein